VNINTVHVGFVNNLSELTLKAIYQDGTVIRQEVARTVNGTRSTLELPLLDCDPQKVAEFKGGNSIFMPSSNEQIEDQTRRTVASHQPEASVALKSPSGSPLASVAGGYAFKTFIVAYSEDLPFSYSVIGEADWTALFDGTVSNGNYKTASGSLVTSPSEFNSFANPKDPQLAGCEIRPPAFFPAVSAEVTAQESDGSRTVCTFIKKARKGNIRKKGDSASEETDATVVVQPKKEENKNPMVQSTKDYKKQKEDFSFASTNSAMSNISADMGATAMIETETERDKDAQAIRERSKKDQEILAGEEAERAEKVYRGMGAYTEYVQKRDNTGGIKGTGIKAGPVRGTIYARAISRMDYQPDVCKDYKETGTCGYGISCKFLHDRGDYKNSVELDKEWEQEQAAKKARLLAALEEEERAKRDSDDEDVPFACTICRKAFTNPVKTKCGHFFCEKCALPMAKCRVCGADTNKVFKSLAPQERAKLDKARLKFQKREANEPMQEDDGPQDE
jgi:RING finger protein 113A